MAKFLLVVFAKKVLIFKASFRMILIKGESVS
jgi:hypothetical protein